MAGHSSDQIENMVPVKDRIIKVTFNADVHASLQWNFRPQQTEIYVSDSWVHLSTQLNSFPNARTLIVFMGYNSQKGIIQGLC